MSSQLRAIALMLVAVVAWSFFPFIGARETTDESRLILIAAAWLCSSLVAVVIAMWLLRGTPRSTLVRYRVALTRRHGLRYVALAGGLNLGSHILLFVSFDFLNKAAAAVIYDTWPLLFALALPFLLATRYQRMSATHIAYGLVGVCGLGILSYDSIMAQRVDLAGDAPAMRWIGLVIAITATFCQAAGTASYQTAMARFGSRTSPLTRVIVLQAIYGLTGGLLLTGYLVISGRLEGPAELFAFQPTAWIYGVGILLIGNLAFFQAMHMTRSSSLALLWYLTPLLSLVWLFVGGLAAVTVSISVGAVLIIVSNILTNFPAERSPAYAAVMIAIGLSAAINLSFAVGRPTEGGAELVGIPAGVFAILVAFMMDRASAKKNDLVERLLSLMEEVRLLRQKDRAAADRVVPLIGRLLRRQSTARNRLLIRVLTRNLPDNESALRECATRVGLAFSKPFSFGELLVLWIVGAATVLIAQLVLPATPPGQVLAVSLTVAIVFLCVHVMDFRDWSAIRTLREHYQAVFDRTVGAHGESGSRLSLVLTIILLVCYLAGVLAKYS